MKQKAEKLKKAYEEMGAEEKQSMGKLSELFEKWAVAPDDLKAVIENTISADQEYPELENIEKMTSKEYAEMYKKMAEDIKANPEKFHHVREKGMSEDELAFLFAQINGTVEKYPEIWESQEHAQLLHPKNLGILIDVFKK